MFGEVAFWQTGILPVKVPLASKGTVTTLGCTLPKQPAVVIVLIVTLCCPEVAKACVGFCRLEVFESPLVGSPKFQFQI